MRHSIRIAAPLSFMSISPLAGCARLHFRTTWPGRAARCSLHDALHDALGSGRAVPASSSEQLDRDELPGARCTVLCVMLWVPSGPCPPPLPNNSTGMSCPVLVARCFAQSPMWSKTAFHPRLGRKAASRYHLNSVPAHAHRAHPCPDPSNGGRPADLLGACRSACSSEATQPRLTQEPRTAVPSLGASRGLFPLHRSEYVQLSYHAHRRMSSIFPDKSE